jgi:hypothetical protein
VTIVDNAGKRISRLGDLDPGLGPTGFLAPHGLAVNTRGDPYVGGGVMDQLTADLQRQAAAG